LQAAAAPVHAWPALPTPNSTWPRVSRPPGADDLCQSAWRDSQRIWRPAARLDIGSAAALGSQKPRSANCRAAAAHGLALRDRFGRSPSPGSRSPAVKGAVWAMPRLDPLFLRPDPPPRHARSCVLMVIVCTPKSRCRASQQSSFVTNSHGRRYQVV